LHQMDVPVLAIVAGDLLVYGAPGEQRVEPVDDLDIIVLGRRGEDQPQLLAQQPEGLQVTDGNPAAQVRPVGNQGPVGIDTRQPVVTAGWARPGSPACRTDARTSE